MSGLFVCLLAIMHEFTKQPKKMVSPRIDTQIKMPYQKNTA